MYKFKKLLSVVFIVALVSSINWSYFTQLLTLTKSAAIECITGGSASGTALTAELQNISISKFFEFNVDDFLSGIWHYVTNDGGENIENFSEDVANYDITEDTTTDSTTEGGREAGLKSGRQLLNNIQKIKYGSTELSQMALDYRKAAGITSARRNVAVVEYMADNGELVSKQFVSDSVNHAEEKVINYLMDTGIEGNAVTQLFTEREPCVHTSTNSNYNCTQAIIDYMPNVNITYVVDYGVTQEDGKEARILLKALLDELLEEENK